MEKYRVMEKPLFLKEGILTLTDVQAGPRKHLLKRLKKGKYSVENEACFKVGEVIGIDDRYAGPLFKIGLIEYEDKAAAEAKAKAKAEAAADAEPSTMTAGKAMATKKADEAAAAEPSTMTAGKAMATKEGKDTQGLAGKVLDKVLGKDKDNTTPKEDPGEEK